MNVCSVGGLITLAIQNGNLLFQLCHTTPIKRVSSILKQIAIQRLKKALQVLSNATQTIYAGIITRVIGGELGISSFV